MCEEFPVTPAIIDPREVLHLDLLAITMLSQLVCVSSTITH